MEPSLLAIVVAIVAPVSALAGAGVTWAIRIVRRADLVVAASDAELRARAADQKTIKAQRDCIETLRANVQALNERVDLLEQKLREITTTAAA